MSSNEKQGEQAGERGTSIVQERLNWKRAERDDTRVAQGLYAGEEIEEMHQLSDAGLLDEFFVYLEEIGMLETFEQMVLPEVKRVLVPTVQFVLLYFLKVLFGNESMNELPRVLFSDWALMELVGFNAQHCAEGLTKRGEAARKTKKKQGPITPQCLADNISKLKQEEMEPLFTQMVQLLARRGVWTGQLLVALDGSKLPTPKSYEGCGKVKQTRKVKVKGQKEAATEEYYDWRSVIENGIFKEGKHPWHLLKFPKRTEAAVVVHCHFTLLVMGLCTAFRLWQAHSAITPSAQTEVVPSLSSALLGGEGTAR